MNACREPELELAANQAEPENQAGLVPGPDPDPKKILNFIFQKIKSATMPDHHAKGQPPVSTYVREKVGVTCDTNRETPCRSYDHMVIVVIVTPSDGNFHLHVIKC